MAAPAAPKAVSGTAIASGDENPNNGAKAKSIFLANKGNSPTPSYAAPVNVPVSYTHLIGTEAAVAIKKCERIAFFIFALLSFYSVVIAFEEGNVNHNLC